ncbi:MAG: asparagine synthase (glutamine-hydrolyzing) [Lachnospiraceae bacterium]
MCGIAGFYHREQNYREQAQRYRLRLKAMHQALQNRGPEDFGIYLSNHCGLSHSRLSIIDITGGHQPMMRSREGRTVGIVYNGELYNAKELRCLLEEKGCHFTTTSDTEVVLLGIMTEGPEFVKRLNGIFAFAIWDAESQRMMLARDAIGVKPLFYTICEEEVIFASEIKGILAHPCVQPQIDVVGLNEIFSMGPARTPGNGVLKGIKEVLPGEYLLFSLSGCTSTKYWKLESHAQEDSYEKTVEQVSYLVSDSISRQMISDVPICTFLSGGVDSSLVSAICAKELKKQGKKLDTFSFDFVNNGENFKANEFQPSLDRPYVEQMVTYLGSHHKYLECDNKNQIEKLFDSVKAHDLPAMADVDSSMLYFCSQVSKTHKVALTGECADEIFGGYPWFHKKECMETQSFPWTMDLAPRKEILSKEFLEYLNMDYYVENAYYSSLKEVPRWEGDTPIEARRREIAYLNLKWFMQTLLNRMDRTSMYSGLEARVPFADTRIVQYVWNVPWEMKAKNQVVKSLLRESGRGMLPEEVLFRKKSPYPKTYDPSYENSLKQMVLAMAEDSKAPVLQFLDKKKLQQFLEKPSNYGAPWYGQLMAGPQMLAYLLQINYWLEEYKIQII